MNRPAKCVMLFNEVIECGALLLFQAERRLVGRSAYSRTAEAGWDGSQC